MQLDSWYNSSMDVHWRRDTSLRRTVKLVMQNMIETKINNPNMYLLIHDLIASFNPDQLTRIALEQSMHLVRLETII
jgi:hypothetical protein